MLIKRQCPSAKIGPWSFGRRLFQIRGHRIRILGIALFLFIIPAFGYVDPGTGSYLVQLLIGSFLGTLYLIGQFRVRIMTMIRNFFRNKNP